MASVSPCFLLSQDESTTEIMFYMKGADVAMSSIVQYNDWLEEEVRRVSHQPSASHHPSEGEAGGGHAGRWRETLGDVGRQGKMQGDAGR